MLIDKFIELRFKNDTPLKKGGNKKVRVFDDYVLLAGGFKEDEIKKVILITNVLKDKGIAVVPTLEYKIVYPPNELGYARGYILQPRAKGTEIYNSEMSEEEYEKRLRDIANMDIKKIDRFVSDWLAIENAGLIIDPSKTTNFFYSEEGISFIDLNVKESKNEPLKVYFLYTCGILTDYLRKLSSEKLAEYIIQIIKKVALCFMQRGLEIKEITEVISSRRLNNSLNKTQIYSVIEFLTKKLDETPTGLEKKSPINPMEQIRSGRSV